MSSQELFSPLVLSDDRPEPNSPHKQMGDEGRRIQVERSALWAAYADALGWISELTDERGLSRRTSGEPLVRPIAWKRRIGGPNGITASLPEGCYSDDSQLRLSTGRAIGPDRFDVEAFAKVELPVWLSYALGGGRATTAAAENLSRGKATWFANQFQGWSHSGGNGAAMRIQPHVWAAPALEEPESYLIDIVRNSICTHSHPTGIMGAVLHSLALARAMDTGCCPSPSDLLAAVDVAATVPEMIRDDTEIGSYWLTCFQQEAGSFDEAWTRAVAESKDAINAVSHSVENGDPKQRYAEIADQLGLRKRERQGSGILTAVAGVALTWCDPRPEEALQIAVNAIGTDTDTIATMAGAILGATADAGPPGKVLDADLFRAEAARLSEIACGKRPNGHDYPDLLHWSPPRGRAFALARMADGGLRVSGLGRAEEISQPIQSRDRRFQWQWVRLEHGQTTLIKRCPELERARDERGLSRRSSEVGGLREAEGSARPQAERMKSNGRELSYAMGGQEDREQRSERTKPLDLQSALEYVAVRRSEDRIVGKAMRRVVNEGTPAEIAGFITGLVELLRQPKSVRPLVADQSGSGSKEGRSQIPSEENLS